jgi:hypothetical protein
VVLQKYDILINKTNQCQLFSWLWLQQVRHTIQEAKFFQLWMGPQDAETTIEADFHQTIQLLQISADELTEEISRSVEEVSPL